MNLVQPPNSAAITKHDSPIKATLTALRDLLQPRIDIERPDQEQSMVGRRIFITGATSGLGLALARDCARRGAELLVVGRKSTSTLKDELKALGSPKVEALACDLSDLDQVVELIDALKKTEGFDTLVLNAGLLPNRTRITPQGFEEMFAVHFASNLLLLNAFGNAEALQRIILTSSEAHRSSPPVTPKNLGVPAQYGLSDGMKWYGQTKLLLLNQLWLNTPPGQLRAALCPGPIASNIARESPPWVKPLLGPLMGMLFNSPEKAITPLLYLLLEPKEKLLTRSGVNYLHMRAWKHPSRATQDSELQQALRAEAEKLLQPWLMQTS